MLLQKLVLTQTYLIEDTRHYTSKKTNFIMLYAIKPKSAFREDLRRWFIQQEMDLFRYRFNELHSKYKTEFLHKNNLKYDTVRTFFFHWLLFPQGSRIKKKKPSVGVSMYLILQTSYPEL